MHYFCRNFSDDALGVIPLMIEVLSPFPFFSFLSLSHFSPPSLLTFPLSVRLSPFSLPFPVLLSFLLPFSLFPFNALCNRFKSFC